MEAVVSYEHCVLILFGLIIYPISCAACKLRRRIWCSFRRQWCRDRIIWSGPRVFQMKRFDRGAMMVIGQHATDNNEYRLFNICEDVLPGYTQAFADATASGRACVSGLWCVRVAPQYGGHPVEVIATCYGVVTEDDLLVRHFSNELITELAQYCYVTRERHIPGVSVFEDVMGDKETL